MANQALFSQIRALDANAYALPGATATFYITATTTLITVYSDEAGLVPTTNPVIADGAGAFPQTYFNGDAKVVVRDADGVTLYTLDPCPSTSSVSTGAASVSFSPTVNIPQTNVQDAIEGVDGAWRAALSNAGIGVTGDAPLLAALDATGTAAGVYRFQTGTTGTFPSGVTAATTGLVVLDRQSATQAMQTLRAAGQSRVFVRVMTASVWGSWRENINFDPAATAGILAKTGAGASATRTVTGSGGIVVTNGDGVAGNINIAGSGWTLHNGPSGTAIAGTDVANTVTGLGIYRDVRVVVINSTATVSNRRAVRVGDSGGIITTAIYQPVDAAALTLFRTSDAAVGSRSFTIDIYGFNTTEIVKPSLSAVTNTDVPVCINSATAFDRIQIFTETTANNLTGGTYYIFGRT